MLRNFVRHSSSARPSLSTILPKKKTINRLLFDADARLAYSKMLPILNSVYTNLDEPEQIRLPPYTKHDDLMILRSILHNLRSVTNSVNKNLVDLENELVEQAAELGNNDAIAMLAFESIASPDTSPEDYEYANGLIRQLTERKHPLSFKLAGDLAFSKNYHAQAAQYWHEFLDLEDKTVLASHVHSNLGIYYYHYVKPHADLVRAKMHLEKAICFGELDTHIVKAHYYLGQLYTITDPELSRYHLEISASRGLQESFPSLGFMELNVFDNVPKALEWFKLGVEASSDLACLVGQFDAHVRAHKQTHALNVLSNLQHLKDKLDKVLLAGVPDDYKDLAQANHSLLTTFFETRRDAIQSLRG
ncbi:hypothetical protein EJF18_20621 [Clavispora lusitaniae]|uniref:Uncharacterized protein n=1 Tax=Clavispora lusitaniae TaxID=36911 RepID=A0ACD0WH87_CLALS|nr:hypothetical protein E0198_001499 [Clavispora lusitaniae]KAF7583339.1 hypothetical protein FOB63_001557 [Clavispora lusitaniae]QFZ26706.1 hypothetical protein EJF14_20621 [Clavispora lusitaniae]QFZ32374.1 hypothetical protein EJF16_20621 [Clavispora lusitaniae]QFZ38043.1 hypothetical protein EJF15_20621 [Clavispora lusitaniae]